MSTSFFKNAALSRSWPLNVRRQLVAGVDQLAGGGRDMRLSLKHIKGGWMLAHRQGGSILYNYTLVHSCMHTYMRIGMHIYMRIGMHINGVNTTLMQRKYCLNTA